MNAAQKRQKAINILRGTGMTDDEIAAELGIGSLDELTEVRDESEIIDAEVVEIQNDSARDNLPALVSKESPTHRKYPPKPPPSPAMDRRLANHPEKRCKATKTNGEQCRRFAIAGSTVCRHHGGAARQVMNKARTRLEMAANRLVGKELEFALDDTKPAAVQLDAVKDSLNRIGLVKPAQVEFGPIKPYEEVFDGIASVTREDSRRARGITDDSFDLADYQNESISKSPADSLNDVDYQPDSFSYCNTEPALADDDQAVRESNPIGSDSDCDRPASTLANREPSRDRSPRPEPRKHTQSHGGATLYPPLTGEDAIRAANAANAARFADQRGLPPGRRR